MSFLTLRQQINNWTLREDDQFFQAVEALSQNIFESEKQITENISSTKYSLQSEEVQLGFGFNQFLKLSEHKFTQNKIEERLEGEGQEKKKVEVGTVGKNRMDLYKEALSIGLKNLEIKEDQGDKDNASVATVSQYSYAMGQAIFKNTRLPPLFGSRQFATQPFLNLYTEEDANEIYRNSMASQMPTSPDSNKIKRQAQPEPTHPVARSQTIVLTSPQPQPSRRSLEQTNTSRNLLAPILPTVERQTREEQIPSRPEEPQQQPEETKILSFQEQLNLKLLKGQNYTTTNAPALQEPSQPLPQTIRNTLQPPQTSKPVQPPLPPVEPALRASITATANYKDIISDNKRFGATQEGQLFDEEEEEENPIFVKSKTRKKEEDKKQEQSAEVARRRQQEKRIKQEKAKALMSKPTFDDNVLFKPKKAAPILTNTKNQIKKNIFQGDSDQDQSVLVKPTKKTGTAKQPTASPSEKVKDQKLLEPKPSPQPIKVQPQQKKSSPLTSTTTGSKQTQKKEVKAQKGNLFDDQQEDEEDFFKKKKENKSSPVSKPVKKNLLLDEGDGDEPMFKKKTQPIIAPTTKPVEVKISEINKPAANPLGSSSGTIKPEPTIKPIQTKVSQKDIKKSVSPITAEPSKDNVKSKDEEVLTTLRQKKKMTIKKGLFDDDEDETPLSKTTTGQKVNTRKEVSPVPRALVQSQTTQRSKQIFTSQIISSRMSQEQKVERREQPLRKDPKRIVGIMGMGPQIGPMIPSGMVITKPSEAKIQERKALEKMQQQKKLDSQQVQRRYRERQSIKESQLLSNQTEQNQILRKSQIQQEVQREREEKERIHKQQILRERQEQEKIKLEKEKVRKQEEEIAKIQENRLRIIRQEEKARAIKQQEQEMTRREEEQTRIRIKEQKQMVRRQEEKAMTQRQEERERALREQEKEMDRKEKEAVAKKQSDRIRALRQEQRQIARREEEKERIKRQEEQVLARRLEENAIARRAEAQARALREKQQAEKRLLLEKQQEQQQRRLNQQQQEERLKKQLEKQSYEKQLQQYERQKAEYDLKMKQYEENQRLERQKRQRQALIAEQEIKEKKVREEKELREREERQRQQERVKQLALKKTPLGGVPKMPSKQGPKKLPSIPSPVKKQSKRTLFDEEEEQIKPIVPKKVEKKAAAVKGNLFDDEEQDFNFAPKPKAVKKESAKKKTLFDDDDQDDGLTFSTKPKVSKKPATTTFNQQSTPMSPTKPALSQQGPKQTLSSKGGLFGTVDQDNISSHNNKSEKSPQRIKQQPIKKKGLLFGESDEEPEIKRKTVQQPKPQPIEVVRTTPKVELPPKETIEPLPRATKKGIFEDDQDLDLKKVKNIEPVSQPPKKIALLDEPVSKISVASKKQGLLDDDKIPISVKPNQTSSNQLPVAKKRTIFDDDEPEDFSVMVKKVNKIQAKPKGNLFGDDEDDDEAQFAPKVNKPPAKNKRKLFDDSD